MNIKKFKYFYPEKPVLMNIEQVSFDEMCANDDWVAEKKYNGQRCMLWIIDGKVEFWGRHGKLLKYNEDPATEIVNYLAGKFPKGVFLFDGELRHNKTKGVQHKLVIWDVFIFRDLLLNKMQYWTRRAILKERGLEACPALQVSLIEQYRDDWRSLYKAVIEDDEIEGLVLKNQHGYLDISRSSGRDSNWMFKVRKPSGRYAF
jgi:ATP-dependent DNA ligase